MNLVETVSIRTQVRDAFVAALKTIDASPTVRQPGGQVVTNYLAVDELRKYPTYCVVVTHEDLTVETQMVADVRLEVMVVIYARDESDVRAALDGAIEDAWDAIRIGQLVQGVSALVELKTIETDEGTTIAKPFAQAVMKWTAHVRRDVSW